MGKVKAKKKATKKKLPNPGILNGRGMGTGAGNPRKIETPERLMEYFIEFKNWCKDNPMQKHVGTYKGKKIYEDRPRAIVFKAFEGWLSMMRIVGCDLSSYERNVSYLPILKEIKSQCSFDTIQGALNGTYNANLSARLENLVERVDNTSGGDKVTQAPNITIYNTGPKLSSDEKDVDTKK